MNERPEEMLRALGDAPVPSEGPGVLAARRARIVGRVAGAIRDESEARAKRARRRRWVASFAAAAALVFAVGAGWQIARSTRGPTATIAPASSAHFALVSGNVVRVHAGSPTVVPAHADAPLEPGDEVTTSPDAQARIVLASGTNVEIAAASKLRLDRAATGDVVGVSVGVIAFKVPTLADGESFVVSTPNAEIIVRGTAFEVTVRDSEPRTRVRVKDGTVLVRAGGVDVVVNAGDEWPRATTLPAPPITPTASATVAVVAPPPTTAVPPTPIAPSAPPKESTLADQNRLLQSALDARRGGNNGRCLALLDELLSRYPRSPLVQEARVERFRTLERMGQHAAAVADARRYLADYANGFARDEAKTIVFGSK